MLHRNSIHVFAVCGVLMAGSAWAQQSACNACGSTRTAKPRDLWADYFGQVSHDSSPQAKKVLWQDPVYTDCTCCGEDKCRSCLGEVLSVVSTVIGCCSTGPGWESGPPIAVEWDASVAPECDSAPPGDAGYEPTCCDFCRGRGCLLCMPGRILQGLSMGVDNLLHLRLCHTPSLEASYQSNGGWHRCNRKSGGPFGQSGPCWFEAPTRWTLFGNIPLHGGACWGQGCNACSNCEIYEPTPLEPTPLLDDAPEPQSEIKEAAKPLPLNSAMGDQVQRKLKPEMTVPTASVQKPGVVQAVNFNPTRPQPVASETQAPPPAVGRIELTRAEAEPKQLETTSRIDSPRSRRMVEMSTDQRFGKWGKATIRFAETVEKD